jgi:hypothetical protein
MKNHVSLSSGEHMEPMSGTIVREETVLIYDPENRCVVEGVTK